MSPGRLIHTGNAVVDLVIRVPALPPRGGDVLAAGGRQAPGGGVNVAVAAARQGLAVVYAGAHGAGPRGELVRAALAHDGVELAGPPLPDIDTGFVVTLVEPDGERTFVTVPGAEARLTRTMLDACPVGPSDMVYVTGYSLAHCGNRQALGGWLEGLPRSARLVFDPGPLVADLPEAALRAALVRADCLSANASEAAWLAARLARAAGPVPAPTPPPPSPPPPSPPPGEAALRLARHFDLAAVVRAGADGCFVAEPGWDRPRRLAGFDAPVVDTNGAGDTHVGVMMAALAEGLDLIAAARRANAAAALAAGVPGGAAAPRPPAIDAFLAACEGL